MDLNDQGSSTQVHSTNGSRTHSTEIGRSWMTRLKGRESYARRNCLCWVCALEALMGRTSRSGGFSALGECSHRVFLQLRNLGSGALRAPIILGAPYSEVPQCHEP